jgi:hypothetical protein
MTKRLSPAMKAAIKQIYTNKNKMGYGIVGHPTLRRTACALVNRGLAQWGVPFWGYKYLREGYAGIALTYEGNYEAEKLVSKGNKGQSK